MKIRKVEKLNETHSVSFTWDWCKNTTRQTYICPTCYTVRRLNDKNSLICPICKKDIMLVIPWYLSIPKKNHIKKFLDSLIDQYKLYLPKFFERIKLKKYELFTTK